MGRPNTHRDALIAELIGDVDALLERAEALQSSLPAVVEAAGKLDKAARELPRAVSEFPEKVREAARDAIGPLTAAAIVAARAKLGKEIEKTVEETKGEVRQAAAEALREVSEQSQERTRLLTGAVLVVVALFAGGLGYGVGRLDHSEMRREAESLALRADAEDWLQLARVNTDLKGTLRDNCTGKADFLVQGVRACSVPLWLERPAGPAVGGAEAPIGLSVGNIVRESGPMLWVVLGLVGGVFVRKIIVQSSRLRSARWLLDL